MTQTSNFQGGGNNTSQNIECDEVQAAEQEERMQERMIHVNRRVDELIRVWNKTKNVEEFQKETDPFVILALQKRLHSELSDDMTLNIESIQRYLTKNLNINTKADNQE